MRGTILAGALVVLAVAVAPGGRAGAGANREIPWTKAVCHPACAPPIGRFSLGARFLAALNRVPTPPGPSYTTLRSLTDTLVQPALPEATAPVIRRRAAAAPLRRRVTTGA